MGLWKRLKIAARLRARPHAVANKGCLPGSPSTPTTASLDFQQGISSKRDVEEVERQAVTRCEPEKTADEDVAGGLSPGIAEVGRGVLVLELEKKDAALTGLHEALRFKTEKLSEQEQVVQEMERVVQELKHTVSIQAKELTERRSADEERTGELANLLEALELKQSAEEARHEMALLESGRIVHLESRVVQLEDENRELRERLMQREADLLGIEAAVESTCYVEGTDVIDGHRSPPQPRRKPSSQSKSPNRRRGSPTVTPTKRAPKSRPPPFRRSAKATRARHPTRGSALGAPLNVDCVFSVAACCDSWKASGAQNWSAAVWVELEACTGGRGSELLRALGGIANTTDLHECQEMLDSYAWHQKSSGSASSFNVYQHLPKVVALYSRAQKTPRPAGSLSAAGRRSTR